MVWWEEEEGEDDGSGEEEDEKNGSGIKRRLMWSQGIKSGYACRAEPRTGGRAGMSGKKTLAVVVFRVIMNEYGNDNSGT